MTTRKAEDERSDSSPRRFQYSLRALLVLTTLSAVACAVFFAFPVWVGIVALLCTLLFTPVVLTIGLIHRPGYLRTFCIGALFPAGISFIASGLYTFVGLLTLLFDGSLGLSADEGRRIGVLIFLGVYCALVILSGLLAVFVRWRLEAPDRHASRDSHVAAGMSETGDTDFDARKLAGKGR